MGYGQSKQENIVIAEPNANEIKIEKTTVDNIKLILIIIVIIVLGLLSLKYIKKYLKKTIRKEQRNVVVENA